MQCNKIAIRDFRNIEQADVEFSPFVTLIIGDNAQGKTNLLEAVSLMALGKSFRGAKDSELIRFGQQSASLDLTYADSLRTHEVSAQLYVGRRRKMTQNGFAVTKMADMVGAFRVVLFCPEHLSLIKSGPDMRRSFLDIAISQLSPVYMASLARYNRVLKERNLLLKGASESEQGRRVMEDTIDLWSVQLAHEAAVIARYRAAYIKRIKQHATAIFADMTDGREMPDFQYAGSSHGEIDAYLDAKATEQVYLALLRQHHDREVGAGYTLWGIHKDDITITLNGKDARVYASQGQQRSLSLAMKLSEGEISRESSGEEPVYLFDDVLSELDRGRRQYLIENIRQKQVIMTGCEYEDVKKTTDACLIRAEKGKFQVL